jgi:hypothetical protein
LMLITGSFGASSAGFSSRFSKEGGVGWGLGVGLADGAFVAAVPCFLGVAGVCASAVDARKMQINSLRIIVGFLSPSRASQAAIS